ncbi:MAG: peptide deformylase [Desulfobulbaceae bacterium]|nr:MAG: peptide deformylase [Desulfobulbaceae bacterium]
MSNNILILGNPLLRETSEPITDFSEKTNRADFDRLKSALENFRQKNGFGRGMAGIQIGIKKRIVALNLGEGPFVIINPEIIERSNARFTMWDDCMSFPDLMVRVARNKSIGIRFQDEKGLLHEWRDIEQDKAELLQHEIDHLDGIMAVDRAITPTDIIYRNEFEGNASMYNQMVDYAIKPTT